MTFNQLDLICFSHLRWSFVLQRPQHLMSRFARQRRVFFWEEPVFSDAPVEAGGRLQTSISPTSGVQVVTPVLPAGLAPVEASALQAQLLVKFLADSELSNYIAWYYTPMALEFTSVLNPELIIYDCMDELSAFAGAPPALRQQEAALFAQANLVFTGGVSLYESKRRQHGAVFAFPSSVDTDHFCKARSMQQEPEDQSAIGRPRLGYAGVIDERMDMRLLRDVAEARPEWQFILLGPVVKIDPESIPKLPNIHLLGMKKYDDLPAYFGGWEIGLLPFALNEATRYISPTKTPEYLAAGLRVISTGIRDVISPYGERGLVRIVDGPQEFMTAAEEILRIPAAAEFAAQVEQMLAQSSWETTWRSMELLMRESFEGKIHV